MDCTKKNTVILERFRAQNELYHHGILGQKWGIRRYQPYGQGYDPQNPGKYVGKRTTRDYKKALKGLQSDSDKAFAWEIRQRSDSNKLGNKAAKAIQKGKPEKVQKYLDKQKSLNSDVADLQTTRKRIDQTIETIIKDAEQNGIKVDSKSFPRSVTVMNGKEVALATLAALGGGIWRKYVMVPSKEYKVQKTDEQQAKEKLLGDLEKFDRSIKRDLEAQQSRPKSQNEKYIETMYEMKKDGYKDSEYDTLEKEVKRKDGKTVKVLASSNMRDNVENEMQVAKKLEKSLDAIEKNAVKQWVDQNAEWVMKNYPDVTKQKLMNGLELSSVGTSGVAQLKPKMNAKELSWMWFPYVEFDPETGKMGAAGYDD